MSILDQLGINHTVFFQLAIFLFTITTLAVFVMKPYIAALELREHNTKGGEALATEVVKKTVELKQDYETKARQLNDKIRDIYEQQRQQASADANQLLAKSREEANQAIEATRKQIKEQTAKAAQKLKEEAPAIATLIQTKLLARNGGEN